MKPVAKAAGFEIRTIPAKAGIHTVIPGRAKREPGIRPAKAGIQSKTVKAAA